MGQKFRKSPIGLNVIVTKSKNKANIGIEGKIIDETKNTITIKDKKGTKKMILKSNVELKEKSNCLIIDGKSLFGKIEERIKK